MKLFIIIMMLCSLVGCASHSPFPPDVSGTPEPVNSPAIIQELGNV